MVWTAPMTFVDGRPLTSAQLNTHLRDNMLELAPAKAHRDGGYFVTETPHNIVQRIPRKAYVDGTASSASTSYTDLPDSPGPIVRMRTGTTVAVFLSSRITLSGATHGRVACKIEGATSKGADDGHSFTVSQSNPNGVTGSSFFVVNDLTPGDHVFTMQYRVSSQTGTWFRRRLIVMPF